MYRKLTTLSLMLLLSCLHSIAASYTDVSMTVSGMTTTMSNGKLKVTINSSGRVSSMKFNLTHELLDNNGVYFDYTTANGNQGLSPDKVEIIKDTTDYCEVLYSATSGNTIWQQGYIMRRDITALYTYVIATGTATSADEPIKEARVCTRLANDMLNGYVDYRMNGTIPSNSEMLVAEEDENTIADATYYLTDGSVYTKYNWANYIDRDTVHGLSNGYYGVWNIPISYEWLNGGPERQELTVHATSKSPITIQMLQGEHFGGQAMTLEEGEQKLYGPFIIYCNYNSPTITGPIANAQRIAREQKETWPFTWFENALYPLNRGTVSGHLDVTTGQRNDSVRIILAQEKGVKPIRQFHGYQFWTLTDANGDFTLPNVRPGTYYLYAYAKAGEVTDVLELDDEIIVTEGEQSIGTITWTPTKYDNLLWMLGQNDRRSSEFHYSDTTRQYGLSSLVPSTLTYTIGESNPRTDWYYAQCSKGTWTLKFNLDQTYSGTGCLSFGIAGSVNSSTVSVALNGTTLGTIKPGINDASVYRSATQSGIHHEYSFTFDASKLKSGSNTVTLNMTTAGGIMYDCIKLEAGNLVTGIQGVTADDDAAARAAGSAVTKTIKDGRLVIITPRGTYTADGAKVE